MRPKSGSKRTSKRSLRAATVVSPPSHARTATGSGPRWYKDLDICLQKAKQLDLQMWIFDERWWPSQSIGGKVPPRYAAKTLVAEAVDVTGPKSFEADGYGGERYIAAVAGRLNAMKEIEGESLLDLAPFIKDGKLTWNAPAGDWQVIKFTHKQAPGLGQRGGKELSIDGASRDCTDWFIQTVYQPHYDHFKDDFGKTIPGFFYDEPETKGDWGTELNVILKEWGVDWKKAYVAYKFKLAGDDDVAARYQYMEAIAEAWGRVMYGGMTKWCHEHDVMSIGHFMEHGNLYLRPDYCAGDMMRLQKYSDMGGIDLVVRQMYPGQRPHDIYQTPKLGSSISHVYGKKDDLAMCEIFGGYNQVLTYPQMKWLTDQHQVRGINFMIPHSFNPKAPNDRDYPPYFYNDGHEPRWPLYRVYADYTSRLSLMLTGGRHVCPVAILFSGNAQRVGKLRDARGHDHSPAGRPLRLRLAAVRGVRRRCLLGRQEHHASPGTLPGSDRAPDRSHPLRHPGQGEGILRPRAAWCSATATCRRSPERSAARPRRSRNSGMPSGEAIPKWAPKPARQAPREAAPISCRRNRTSTRFPPPFTRTPASPPVVEVLEGETDNWLHVLHRVKDGKDVFLICNQDHENKAKTFRLKVTADGFPEIWDAMRNEIASVAFTRSGDSVEFNLVLEPMESVLLVFNPNRRDLPARIEGDVVRGGTALSVNRDPAPAVAKGKVANPFSGTCDVPAGVDLSTTRVFVEMDEPNPEAAARVTINGKDAGGFIGKPFRLEVTRHLKHGANSVKIEPFAPKSVRLVVLGEER